MDTALYLARTNARFALLATALLVPAAIVLYALFRIAI